MTDTMISGEEAIFWDRLQGMPWIEAEQELVLRREGLAAGHVRMSEKKEKALRVGNLSLARHIGREMDAANKTMTVLTERIKRTALSIWEGIRSGKLPDRICASPDCNRAIGCALRGPCFAPDAT